MSKPDDDIHTLQLEPLYGIYCEGQQESEDEESPTANETPDDASNENSDADTTRVKVELDIVTHTSAYLVIYDAADDSDAEPPQTSPSVLVSNFKRVFENETFESEQERLLEAEQGYPFICRKIRVLIYPWVQPPGALLEVEKIICSGTEGPILVFLEDGTVIEESPSQDPSEDSSSISHPECRILKVERQE